MKAFALKTAGALALLAGFAIFQTTQHSAGFLPPASVLLQAVALAGLWLGLLLPDRVIPSLEASLSRLTARFSIFALTVSLLIFGMLILINRFILHSFMNSGDEHSCYFMAQYLSAGKLWATPPELGKFFEVTHIGIKEGKWFSVYPPGWPLVWAAGLKLHLRDILNPLLTAVSVYGLLYLAKKIFGRGTAGLFVLLLSISPFFLLNGASYYSHNLCLLLMVAFYHTVLKWRETEKTGWAAAAGLLLGYACATRYLTAAAMAAPVILYLAQILLKDKSRKTWAPAFAFTIAFAAVNLAHLYYNFLITGNPVNPPNHFLQSHEKLGFISGYTPLTGLQYLYERLLYLADWAPPGLVILFLFWVIPAKIQGTWDGFFKTAFILLPLAYFFYYSWGGNQYGPRYLFEAYPLLLIAAGAWFFRCWEKAEVTRKKMLTGLMLAMIAGTVPLTVKHLSFYERASAERRASYDLAESLEKPSLVFLSGFLGKSRVMAPDDTARNSPFLDTPVLYACDLREENSNLIPFYPERHHYRIHYDSASNRPEYEQLTV